MTDPRETSQAEEFMNQPSDQASGQPSSGSASYRASDRGAAAWPHSARELRDPTLYPDSFTPIVPGAGSTPSGLRIDDPRMSRLRALNMRLADLMDAREKAMDSIREDRGPYGVSQVHYSWPESADQLRNRKLSPDTFNPIVNLAQTGLGLNLTRPEAGRVMDLSRQAADLFDQRAALMAHMRNETQAAPARPSTPARPAPAQTAASAPSQSTPAQPAAPSQSASAQSAVSAPPMAPLPAPTPPMATPVNPAAQKAGKGTNGTQIFILALGIGLIAMSTIVFAAAPISNLTSGPRALLIGLLGALSLLLSLSAAPRLTITAEGLGWLSAVILSFDAIFIQTTAVQSSLFGGMDTGIYLLIVAGILALASWLSYRLKHPLLSFPASSLVILGLSLALLPEVFIKQGYPAALGDIAVKGISIAFLIREVAFLGMAAVFLLVSRSAFRTFPQAKTLSSISCVILYLIVGLEAVMTLSPIEGGDTTLVQTIWGGLGEGYQPADGSDGAFITALLGPLWTDGFGSRNLGLLATWLPLLETVILTITLYVLRTHLLLSADRGGESGEPGERKARVRRLFVPIFGIMATLAFLNACVFIGSGPLFRVITLLVALGWVFLGRRQPATPLVVLVLLMPTVSIVRSTFLVNMLFLLAFCLVVLLLRLVVITSLKLRPGLRIFGDGCILLAVCAAISVLPGNLAYRAPSYLGPFPVRGIPGVLALLLGTGIFLGTAIREWREPVMIAPLSLRGASTFLEEALAKDEAEGKERLKTKASVQAERFALVFMAVLILLVPTCFQGGSVELSSLPVVWILQVTFLLAAALCLSQTIRRNRRGPVLAQQRPTNPPKQGFASSPYPGTIKAMASPLETASLWFCGLYASFILIYGALHPRWDYAFDLPLILTGAIFYLNAMGIMQVQKDISSWRACWLPAFCLIVPSFILSHASGPLVRVIYVMTVCIVLIVSGSVSRLKAPLIIGGAGLIIHVLASTWNYVVMFSQTYWWAWLILAGAVLILVSARAEALKGVKKAFDNFR